MGVGDQLMRTNTQGRRHTTSNTETVFEHYRWEGSGLSNHSNKVRAVLFPQHLSILLRSRLQTHACMAWDGHVKVGIVPPTLGETNNTRTHLAPGTIFPTKCDQYGKRSTPYQTQPLIMFIAMDWSSDDTKQAPCVLQTFILTDREKFAHAYTVIVNISITQPKCQNLNKKKHGILFTPLSWIAHAQAISL